MSLINREALIEAICTECDSVPCMGHEYASGTCHLLDLINAQPEIPIHVPEDIIDRPVYRFRLTHTQNRHHGAAEKRTYTSLAESVWQVKNRLRNGGTVTIEERTGVKSDINRLGKVAFRSREEAEAMLRRYKIGLETEN